SWRPRVRRVGGDGVAKPSGAPTTVVLVGGVELAPNGAPIAYHVLRSHPGDWFTTGGRSWQTQSVRAFGAATGRRNAWLLFKRQRAQQNRGIPYLATILEVLKQIERYTDQEIHAAIVGGSLTVFVKTPDGQGLAPLAALPFQANATTAATSASDIAIDYGAIVDLAPGESIETVSPGRPNTAFAEFIRAQYEQAAVGIGFPYEVFIKHFTNSYSASRAALLEFWKFVIPERSFFASSFCSPYYELAMTEAVIRGRLNAPGFLEDPSLRRAYLRASYIGPSMGQINPVDEIVAAQQRGEFGGSTLARGSSEGHGADLGAEHPQPGQGVGLRRGGGV